MKFVKPKIFHLGQTTLDKSGVAAFLKEIGVSEWSTDAPSDSETLLEVAGRSCYKSFGTELNKNLTKVRNSNKDYISNVINKHDGSVLEHSCDTYALVNVSRVFTHELVRHRHAAYSQESLRFVRLDSLSTYYPDVFDSHPENKVIREIFLDVYEKAEEIQRGLSNLLKLDMLNFEQKKLLTSAMRRLAPDGLTTMLIMSTNHRNWRWLIEMRTSSFAEEEIRKVFVMIYNDLKFRYPNIYFDAVEKEMGSSRTILFNNSKI